MRITDVFSASGSMVAGFAGGGCIVAGNSTAFVGATIKQTSAITAGLLMKLMRLKLVHGAEFDNHRTITCGNALSRISSRSYAGDGNARFKL
ncbi:hypothetical protein [Aquamicrobium zhengzhouense]|uniref:hypothetical protein n=1 Tax=Aquamicrobium zhengzhouense TaxID=2781738 RepID=UPI0018E14785|nr:hypothetical protein [Aquamicrobium zhengzhouense]